MDRPPKLYKTDKGIVHQNKTVGDYCRTKDGEKVAVMWKVLWRMKNSYSMSLSLWINLDRDIEKIFIIDKADYSLYLFDIDTYDDAPLTEFQDELQLHPDRSEAVMMWEQGAKKALTDHKGIDDSDTRSSDAVL